MRMKNIVIGFVCSLIVACGAIRISYAHVIEDMPGDMVYASPEEQDYLYNLIQEKGTAIKNILREAGAEIVKESITPLYRYDVLEYATTGKIVLSLVQENSEGEKFRVYYAKTIKADGTFGGTLDFTVWEDNEEVGGGIIEWLPTSSYADHARRIQSIMGTDSFVSPSDVRLIDANGVPEAFYIRVGEEERIVFMGRSTKWVGGEFESPEKKPSYTVAEFRRAAIEYKEEWDRRRAEAEAWMEANPGKGFPIGGTAVSFGLEYYIDDKEVDNINNIAEYLGIDMTPKPAEDTSKPTSWTTYLPWIGGISAAMLAGGVTLVVLLRKKKQENLSDAA